MTPQCRAAHELAMEAKELVFRAQDAADAMPADSLGHQRLRDRMRKLLVEVRGDLEALDRASLDAGFEDGCHCDCGGFPDGKPHAETCPLYDPADPPLTSPHKNETEHES